MRRAIPVIALLMVAAMPARADTDTDRFERWIGTWSGTATSKGCVTDGQAPLALEIALGASGGLTSDGAAVMDGLGEVDWSPDGTGLSTAGTGFSGTLHTAGNDGNLTVTTDAGCVVTATLQRASSGIDDCDRVLALATTESECTVLPADTRGKALSDATKAWSGWTKLKGKQQRAQAKACRATASALTPEVDACSAYVPVFTTGVAECDHYLRLATAYVHCAKVTRDLRAPVLSTIGRLQRLSNRGIKYLNQSMQTGCTTASDRLQKQVQAAGCPL